MLRHRDIVAARRAFDEGDEAHAIKLSQAAHSLRSVEPEPGSPTTLASTGWTESGHNDELQHTRTTLVLRGCVDGVAISLSALALAEGAGWPSAMARALCYALLGCWAIFSASREGLERLTYRAHYYRERRREEWGARTPRAHTRPAPARHLTATPPPPPHRAEPLP